MFDDRPQKPSLGTYAALVVGLSWVTVVVIGCQTQGPDGDQVRPKVFGSGEGPINSIRLFTSPTLLNLDGEPGLDAFTARVYALRDTVPKPVPFTKGRLEILFFDESSNRDPKDLPRQIWSFSGLLLNQHRIQTSIGYSYDFALEIDEFKPLPAKVSVGARYTPTSGPPVFAKRVSIKVEP
jgi:hypothetical protein